MSLIVRAFCSTSPASAGACECSSKLKSGACHFELSKLEVGIVISDFLKSSFLSSRSSFFEIKAKPFFSFDFSFTLAFSSKISTPAFNLISGFSLSVKSLTFLSNIDSFAFSKTLAFLDSIVKSLVRSISPIFLITTIGETRKIESKVIEINKR